MDGTWSVHYPNNTCCSETAKYDLAVVLLEVALPYWVVGLSEKGTSVHLKLFVCEILFKTTQS